MIHTAIHNMKKSIQNNTSLVNYISTGFEKLDHKILGYQKGELITIASRPNGEKTYFALAIVLNAIENNQKVYYILTGESSEQLISKIIAQKHNINLKDFLLNNYDEKYKQEIYETLDMIEKYLVIDEDLFFDINYLSHKIEYEYRYEYDLIVVDNYSYITKQVDKNINRVCEFKRLAYVSKTPILLVTSFDIVSEKRFAKTPVATDIIDARDIFTYSDKVLALYSDDIFKERVEHIKELKSKQRYENPPYKSAFINKPAIEVQLHILKNNLGDLGQLKFNFHKAIVKFIFNDPLDFKDISMIDIPDIPEM